MTFLPSVPMYALVVGIAWLIVSKKNGNTEMELPGIPPIQCHWLPVELRGEESVNLRNVFLLVFATYPTEGAKPISVGVSLLLRITGVCV